jgi:hypothetical protein
MATRKKIYYTPNEIIEGLYTRGGEWMILDTWENYSGFFHIYESTNEVFSEQSWHPTKSRKLVRFRNKEESYFKYIDMKYYRKVNGEKREVYGPTKYYRFTSPVAVIREPTSSEKSNGLMTRYFLFKRNELSSKSPIEIDKIQADTYDLSNDGINQYLYVLSEIPWKIEGPEFDIVENGIIKVPGVVNTNRRIIDRFSKKFPILRKVLTNVREFSIYNTNNAF